jgi:tetratricopeptide (TPR) repeat protein
VRRLTDPFLEALLAIEAAIALLDNGRVDEAVALAPESVPVLLRAAAMIGGERGHALLERAAGLEGPTAPALVALARSCWTRGDLAQAREAFEAAMLRARPDAPLVLELAALVAEQGHGDRSDRIAAVSASLACRGAGEAVAAGRRLRARGHPRLARDAFRRAYDRGLRDGDFLIDFAASLTDMPCEDAETMRAVPVLAAQARAATSVDVAALVRDASAREASGDWLRLDQLGDFLAERIARAEPFSWIRLGDGEARFLMWQRPALRGTMQVQDARAVIDWIWRNWFGSGIDTVDPARLAALADAFDAAVAGADLLGVPTAGRLAHDAQHVGYLAALERYLTTTPSDERRFCDAFGHYALADAHPLFARLLKGLPFLGLIGPHPGMAGRLAERLGIPETAEWSIPGEQRLGRATAGHFPDVYDHVMATLEVPFRGAVFLVAGGLLGKVYADRIKALGGIALDVGAIVDGWAGVNTRGAVLDRAMASALD